MGYRYTNGHRDSSEDIELTLAKSGRVPQVETRNSFLSLPNPIEQCSYSARGLCQNCWKAKDCASDLPISTGKEATDGRSRVSLSKELAVTYSATAEIGNHTINLPINHDDVSGREKAVMSTTTPKVWEWVQEKKFGNIIDLQAVYDLASKIYHGSEEERGVGL